MVLFLASFINEYVGKNPVSLSDEDIKQVARLAALDVKDEDVPRIREQLNSTIEYVDRLQDLPTRGVVPTFHVHGISNVFREDVIGISFEEQDIQRNAPDFSQGYFKVPQIIKSNN